MSHARHVLAVLGLAAMGCAPTQEAERQFADALKGGFVEFDAEDEVLAPYIRDIETEVYSTYLLESGIGADRARSPEQLTPSDVETLSPRPDTDPRDTLSVAMGYLSRHDAEKHLQMPVLDDQRPLEPQSPNFYERTFLNGKRCWTSRECSWLQTVNDLTKEYPGGIIPSVTYRFYKDFRWLDMNADLEDEEPRWVVIARTWNDDTYCSGATEDGECIPGNNNNILWQSYTLELWLPRDGRGYRWEDVSEDPEPLQVDSTGGGTLRLLSLWTQTDVPLSNGDETLEKGTIQWGIEQNYATQDLWLDQN